MLCYIVSAEKRFRFFLRPSVLGREQQIQEEGQAAIVTADTDTVNDIYLILYPGEKEKMKSDKSLGGLLVRSGVRCGDIPLMDTSRIMSEHTIADVLQMITSEMKIKQ